MGEIEKSLKSKLMQAFEPVEFHLENESHMHSGPRTESHFKIFIVSKVFEGLSRIKRQRLVNKIVKEDFEQGLHALTMRLKTPEEIKKSSSEFQSPDCSSKKKD